MSFRSAAYNAIYWLRKINGQLFTFPCAGFSPLPPPTLKTVGVSISMTVSVARCRKVSAGFLSVFFYFFFLVIFFFVLATHAIKIVAAKAQIN